MTIAPEISTESTSSIPGASIPGAGEKSCKFASACTRAGCVFLHPWDARGDDLVVLCRWAVACTRGSSLSFLVSFSFSFAF
jgi:hypothetical protein